MRYFSPPGPQEALKAMADGEFKVLAGGTDLYPALRDRPVTANILDISGIADFKSIELEQAFWRIGAAVTWSDLIHFRLPSLFDGLKQAAREIGSVQIQNTATLVGNLCNASPAADGVPALLALDAKVEISSVSNRRQMPLADFITGVRKTALQKGEMVTALMIPDDGGLSIFEKLGSRRYLVISIVSASAWIKPASDGTAIASARIAIGSCSPVALRLAGLEKALTGASLFGDDISKIVRPDHFKALAPLADIRGDAEYRRQSALVLTRRLLARLALQARGAAA